jgi:hypothetical protein
MGNASEMVDLPAPAMLKVIVSSFLWLCCCSFHSCCFEVICSALSLCLMLRKMLLLVNIQIVLLIGFLCLAGIWMICCEIVDLSTQLP